MNKLLFTCSILLLCANVHAQLVSSFDWNGSSHFTAAVGPDGISAGINTVTDAGGRDGTTGLATAGGDINFHIPDSEIFNVEGVEISYDMRSIETAGTTVQRGVGFTLGKPDALFVKFQIDNKNGASGTSVTSPTFPMPLGPDLRHIKFRYNPLTGVATLDTNGVQVWMNDGPDMTPLFWKGGDIVIGSGMDANGGTGTLFDNWNFTALSIASLPADIVDFTVQNSGQQSNYISWWAANEHHVSHYSLQRSYNGLDWNDIRRIGARNRSEIPQEYWVEDLDPVVAKVYYRLVTVDFDGTTSIGPVRAVTYAESRDLETYPNPASATLTVSGTAVSTDPPVIFGNTGRATPAVPATRTTKSDWSLDISSLPAGTYTLRSGAATSRFVKL